MLGIADKRSGNFTEPALDQVSNIRLLGYSFPNNEAEAAGFKNIGCATHREIPATSASAPLPDAVILPLRPDPLRAGEHSLNGQAISGFFSSATQNVTPGRRLTTFAKAMNSGPASFFRLVCSFGHVIVYAQSISCHVFGQPSTTTIRLFLLAKYLFCGGKIYAGLVIQDRVLSFFLILLSCVAVAIVVLDQPSSEKRVSLFTVHRQSTGYQLFG